MSANDESTNKPARGGKGSRQRAARAQRPRVELAPSKPAASIDDDLEDELEDSMPTDTDASSELSPSDSTSSDSSAESTPEAVGRRKRAKRRIPADERSDNSENESDVVDDVDVVDDDVEDVDDVDDDVDAVVDSDDDDDDGDGDGDGDGDETPLDGYGQRIADHEAELAERRQSAIAAGRRRGGVVGAAMAGAMLAVSEIIEGPPKEDAPVVVEASSKPENPDEDGITVDVDGKTVNSPPLQRIEQPDKRAVK